MRRAHEISGGRYGSRDEFKQATAEARTQSQYTYQQDLLVVLFIDGKPAIGVTPQWVRASICCGQITKLHGQMVFEGVQQSGAGELRFFVGTRLNLDESIVKITVPRRAFD